MLSKRMYLRVILLAILLLLNCMALAFSVAYQQFEIALMSAFIIILQIGHLIYFLNQTNRQVAYFFNAIVNEDFSLHFKNKRNEKPISELSDSLNKVNELIRSLHQSNKDQEQYYQELLRRINIGVITINQKGHVLFANPSAEKLLNYTPLTHISQLKQVDTKLHDIFASLKQNCHQQFNLNDERETKQLLIKSSDISLNNEILSIVSIQNINTELDEKETDSWMKLIRVLTHEIMNAITPITSISDSLITLNQENEEAPETFKGLKIINKQSDELMHFVQSYRDILSIPNPDKKIVNGKRLIEKVRALIQEESDSKSIEFNILNVVKEVDFFIDEQQITQVLINLCKNAIQALALVDAPQIQMLYGINNQGNKFISIEDNGPGISDELIDQIFIPFFTTKETGTGIGLSLSKRIVQLHGGSLNAVSKPTIKTKFSITF